MLVADDRKIISSAAEAALQQAGLTADRPLAQPDERCTCSIAHSLRAAHHRGFPAILCFTASVWHTLRR